MSDELRFVVARAIRDEFFPDADYPVTDTWLRMADAAIRAVNEVSQRVGPPSRP